MNSSAYELKTLLTLCGLTEGPDFDPETPERILRIWEEFGMRETAPKLTTFICPSGYDEIILWKGGSFSSLCRHHFFPFYGTVSIAYVPKDRIIGLSKLPRLVKHAARRPTLQESLTIDISKPLIEALNPVGLAVIVKSSHTCMSCRGVRSSGEVTTSHLYGCFKSEGNARTELYQMLRG